MIILIVTFVMFCHSSGVPLRCVEPHEDIRSPAVYEILCGSLMKGWHDNIVTF